MARFVVRGVVLALVLAALAAGQPAAAQVIPAGTDFWVTRPDGATSFTFPPGDVEALCGQPPGAPITVVLVGVPAAGSDWDSAVARLNDAVFDSSGVAETKVQFKSLAMRSAAATPTPCGPLVWQARLANVPQPVTIMKIVNSSGRGGTFFAELGLRVEMQANRATDHRFVGRLFYDVKLPDPAGGTVWSFGPAGNFRPGMTETDDCLDVLREKLGTFPPDSDHAYFISDMIAQGQCERKN